MIVLEQAEEKLVSPRLMTKMTEVETGLASHSPKSTSGSMVDLK